MLNNTYKNKVTLPITVYAEEIEREWVDILVHVTASGRHTAETIKIRLVSDYIDPPIKYCAAIFNHPLRKGDCGTKL